MIKAHLPPEKSVYSLPRAAPGSPNHPARTSPSDGRPPFPYPPPKPPPGTIPASARNHSGNILELPPRNHSRNHTHSCACSRTHLESISETSAHGTCSRKHPPRPKPSCTHPREPALKPSLQPPAPETIPGTISETTVPGTDLQTPGPPRPLRKPGHFPRSKAIRPGQGTLPDTNIDRE